MGSIYKPKLKPTRAEVEQAARDAGVRSPYAAVVIQHLVNGQESTERLAAGQGIDADALRVHVAAVRALIPKRESSVWWCKYYANGKARQESTGSEKETEAKRFLKEREGRVATGQPILPRADRVRYEEAANDLREYYRTTGTRDLEEAEYRLKRLATFFSYRRVAGIGQADTTTYAAKRQEQGASNGTINRELAVLNRMLRLAYENGRLLRLPVLRKLKESGPRQGFLEPAQFAAISKNLMPDRRAAAAIKYVTGWRTQSEVMSLTRAQYDGKAGTLRLEPGTTKNGEGRTAYLPPDLKALVDAQVERVRALERELKRVIPYLFPHLSGRHRGERIRDYRRAWATACLEAELGGLTGEAREKRRAWLKANPKTGLLATLRHDLRRTAVRNMVNAGVPERVAMKVTGHKTRAVFDRYHIVSPADLQDVARRLTGYAAATAGRAAREDSR